MPKRRRSRWQLDEDALLVSTLRQIARRVLHGLRRPRGLVEMRRGRISSLTPLSTVFGYDRGTPVDRLYIERFLSGHAADVRGHVLEIADDSYSRRFGGSRITDQDVLDLDSDNPAATIVGDIADPRTLPTSRFDCIIITQTLQYVFDVGRAVENICRSLRPGGVALVTVPGIGPACASQGRDDHYWLFTPASLERSLTAAFDPANVQVTPFGNLYAATAFLHGAAVEELDMAKLQPLSPEYAIVIAARAVA